VLIGDGSACHWEYNCGEIIQGANCCHQKSHARVPFQSNIKESLGFYRVAVQALFPTMRVEGCPKCGARVVLGDANSCHWRYECGEPIPRAHKKESC
jgi:ribosomal protein S27AE